MGNDINQIIAAYAEEHTDNVSELPQDLIRETELITGRARWSIGKVEAKFLQLLIKISNAKRAVEVGTFTGYSALVIAEALPADGQLTTCETNPEYAAIARRYFDQSPHGRKIRLVLGPALETLRRMPADGADFVFIDADKPSYGKYFDEAVRLLRAGGFVVVDNVFWRNKVFKTKITNENAKAIAAFNESVRNDDRVEKVMLSVRDGIYLIRKK